MGNEKKILIVEDDNFLARMLSKTIEAEGYEVIMAGTGEEGWRKASTESGIQLILLDIMLPDLDGFEVLKRIRQHEPTKTTPVIIVSNLGQPEDHERGKALGANDYIIKSNASLDEVVARVKKFLPTT